MKSIIVSLLLLTGAALADSTAIDPSATPELSLRAALDLDAPRFVLNDTDEVLVLAKKETCRLSGSEVKGLLNVCVYECSCGKKELRRKGNQECPKQWYFDC